MSLPLKDTGQKPVLIVLCGPSHAGKTTFANKLNESGENFIIISPDEIRKRLSVNFGDWRYESNVWDIYESMKCKALKAGRNVVLDACHMSERARWHALQGPNAHYRKICIVFDLPWQIIRERCLKGKRLSLDEAERMWLAFQESKPRQKELRLQGFDDVCFIRECHVRAMQSTWPQRNACEMKAVCSAFCHKAVKLMIAASSILLWAPMPLCVHARIAPVFGALWQSLAHLGCVEPTVRVGCRSTFRQRCFIFPYLWGWAGTSVPRLMVRHKVRRLEHAMQSPKPR